MPRAYILTTSPSVTFRLQAQYGLDGQDIMTWDAFVEKSVSQKMSEIEKILLLSHDIAPLGQTFLNDLSVQGITVTQLSSEILPLPSEAVSLSVAPSLYAEASWVVSRIQKLLQAGSAPKDIFIFCKSMPQLVAWFEALFLKHHIPYSRWLKADQNIDVVSLLSFNESDPVFSDMAHVFVCGLGSMAFPRSFFSDVEKGEVQEKLKRLLQWLAGRLKTMTLTATGRFPNVIEQWRQENQLVIIPSTKCEESRRRSFASLRMTRPSTLRMTACSIEMTLPKTYSVSSLVRYQKCPYGFFLQDVLHLYPKEREQATLTSQEEGIVLHACLRHFFAVHGGHVPSAIEKKDLQKHIQAPLAACVDQLRKEIVEPERLRIEETIYRFLCHELTRVSDNKFVPRFFEIDFGKTEPWALSLNGRNYLLKGKIDRVDVHENKKTFVIIDYKTGTTVPSIKSILSGEDFQLTVYAMAVASVILPGFRPEAAFFGRLRIGDVKRGFYLENQAQWDELKSKTKEVLAALLRNIEAHRFEATPEQCWMDCPLRQMCESQA